MDKKKEITSLNSYPPQIQHKSFPDGAFYSDALYAYLGLEASHYSRWCKQYLLKNPAAYG